MKTLSDEFLLTKELKIDELQCTLYELTHQRTGAQVMHIANDDEENLFCLSFKTLPETSNGVAHILEHTVLCGSEKFPVKDPFFSMQRRSLNTFMNALTGSDFTCYPAASQIPKDLYNLLDVYLDAVFHPKLDRRSFCQEGHRLEFQKMDDSSTPLEYKGIVFNEMKGAMSSSSSRLYEALYEALFPDITYGINSGGNPKEIPNLTYEEFCQFHRTYYHPSRCLFFFYGNIPLETHLKYLQENILNQTEPLPPLPHVPKQPRFSSPKKIETTFPSEPSEKDSQIAFSWLTCDILDQETVLALSIIEIALMGTDAAPLKKILLQSRLCTQAGSFLESDITEVPFVFVLKGCDPSNADQLEELLFKSLSLIAEQGIPHDLIDNALHQLEFHRSEITGDHSPFGLTLFMRSALLKQHGALPEESLKIHSLFEAVRLKLAENPRYLEELITTHLLNNQHFVRLIMKPDATLAESEKQIEEEKLKIIESSLSSEAKTEIIKSAEDLQAFQAEQEDQDIDVLPKVTLDDVPRESRDYPLLSRKAGGITTHIHPCFTNQIVYTDCFFDLPKVAEEDLIYLRLFSTLLTQVGCSDRSYVENLHYMQAHTGGVSGVLILDRSIVDPQSYIPSFGIRGKALYRNADKLFTLIDDFATSTDFSDTDRLKELIEKQRTSLQTHFVSSAMRYATSLSASQISPQSKILNTWYGLPYYHKICQIAKNFESELPILLEKFEEFKRDIFQSTNKNLVIGSDQTMYEQLSEEKFYGLESLQSTKGTKWENTVQVEPLSSQGIAIASPVAFTALSFPTVGYKHPDSAALCLAANLLDHKILHKKIREEGGAYGSGASQNPLAEQFSFYAYRDPHINRTLETFHDSLKTLIKEPITAAELEAAKLEMVQGMDSPVSPGSRSELSFGWMREGKTLEERQAFRDRLLGVTDVVGAVEKHLIPNIEKGAAIVFSSEELFKKEKVSFPTRSL